MKKVLLLISTILLISCTEKKVDCNNNSAYKFGKDLGFSAKLSGTTSFESAYDAYENQISSSGAAMPYQKNDQCVKQGFEDESSKTEKKVDCNNNSAYKFGKDLGFSAKLSGTTSFESAYDAYENQISSIGAAMPYQKNDQCVKQGFEDESSK